MSPAWSSVTHEITVDVAASGGGAVRMPVTLHYDTADPFAVRAIFRCGLENEVTWAFARDLLGAGLTRAAGEGDVRIWPSTSRGQGMLRIALISPDGEALLQAVAADVVDFLDATHGLCAAGLEAELLDLDTALEALLAT